MKWTLMNPNKKLPLLCLIFELICFILLGILHSSLNFVIFVLNFSTQSNILSQITLNLNKKNISGDIFWLLMWH